MPLTKAELRPGSICRLARLAWSLGIDTFDKAGFPDRYGQDYLVLDILSPDHDKFWAVPVIGYSQRSQPDLSYEETCMIWRQSLYNNAQAEDQMTDETESNIKNGNNSPTVPMVFFRSHRDTDHCFSHVDVSRIFEISLTMLAPEVTSKYRDQYSLRDDSFDMVKAMAASAIAQQCHKTEYIWDVNLSSTLPVNPTPYNFYWLDADIIDWTSIELLVHGNIRPTFCIIVDRYADDIDHAYICPVYSLQESLLESSPESTADFESGEHQLLDHDPTPSDTPIQDFISTMELKVTADVKTVYKQYFHHLFTFSACCRVPVTALRAAPQCSIFHHRDVHQDIKFMLKGLFHHYLKAVGRPYSASAQR